MIVSLSFVHNHISFPFCKALLQSLTLLTYLLAVPALSLPAPAGGVGGVVGGGVNHMMNITA